MQLPQAQFYFPINARALSCFARACHLCFSGDDALTQQNSGPDANRNSQRRALAVRGAYASNDKRLDAPERRTVRRKGNCDK